MDKEKEAEKNTYKSNNVRNEVKYDIPVDRGWAWIVLIGAFGVCTLAIGGLKSFGVLFVELSRTYSVSNRALASIQSLTGFFYLSTGPVSNALSIKYSHRVVVFIGGLIATTGLVLSSFAKSVEVLYVTYGVITGIGLGLCFSPSLVILAHYFEKRRAFANGLSMSGSGIGSTSLPYLMRYFLDIYSIQGCLMLIAGMMSHLCLFGLMYRPLDKYPIKSDGVSNVQAGGAEGEENDGEAHPMIEGNGDIEIQYDDISNNQTKNVFKSRNISSGDFSSDPNIFAKGKKKKDTFQSEKFKSQELTHLSMSKLSLHSGENSSLFASLGVLSSLSYQNIPNSVDMRTQINSLNHDEEDISTTSKTKPGCCQSLNIDWSLFKEPVFIMYMFSIFCLNCGYHSVFNLLPPYAEELYMSDKNGALLVAVFGILDFCGRFLIGVSMDVCSSWKKQIYFVCTFICAIGVLFTPQFDTIVGLCLFCGFYAFFGGGYNGTLMSIIVDSLGLQQLSTTWGFMCLAGSVAMLLNPMLSGLIKDVTGTWKNSFQLMGSIALIGSLSLLIEPAFIKKKKRRDKSLTIEEI